MRFGTEEVVIVTIRDVARRAGVSVATVSRVLNEPQTVREVKREIVLAAIAELEFRPNLVARGLATKSSGTIALIVSDIANVFFAELVHQLEGPLAENGRDLLLCNTQEREDRLVRYLERVPLRGIDAVILSPSPTLTPAVIDALEGLIARNVPIVCSGARMDGFDLPTIVNDSSKALEELAEHLVSRGCRRIAYMGGPHHHAMSSSRLVTFSQALVRHGLQLEADLTRAIEYDPAIACEAVAELLLEAPDLDAVVCGGDQLALGALKGLKEAGRRVPDDVAVTGFDDTYLAAYADPPLTSIAVNIDETAEAVTKAVLMALRKEPVASSRVTSSLVIRQSSSLSV